MLSFLSSLLGLGLGLGFLILFSSFFFVCVFVSVHPRAQETKASWVRQTSLLRDFYVLFLDAIFFYIFNTVSFVFVHVGLLQILGLRPKIALRFTWVWVLISVWSIIYLFILILKFLLDYVDLNFLFLFFWFIVMFCLHALVVNTSEKMFG